MSDMVDTDLLEEPQVEAVSIEAPSEDNVQKTFDNETVQKIVARERKKAAEKAYEKAKREILMQQEQEQMQEAQAAPQGQQQAPAASSLGGMPQMSHEDIQKLISQQLPQHLASYINEAKQTQQIEGFVSKMRAAEERYPGIEEKLNNYDYSPNSGMTEIVLAANNLENTADIIKEVTDHPHKLANLITLAKSQPYALNEAMQALSSSIKRNQEALAQEQQSKDPMNRLKPSPNTGTDSGDASVADFRRLFKT